MFSYFKSIWRIIRLSSAVVGTPWYLLVIITGLIARLALLVCFISVIKVVVWALASGLSVVPIPFTEQSWHLSSILDASLIAIPVMFAVAGSSLFIAEKCARYVYQKIIAEARIRNIRQFTSSIMHEEAAKRKSEIKSFVNRTEPDFAKSVVELTKGTVELMQASVIIFIVSAGLAMQNIVVFYSVMAIASILVPGYVRRNYIQFIDFKKKATRLREIRAQEFDEIAANERVLSDDVDAVSASIEHVIHGQAAAVQRELEEMRAMGPRKIYPIIYGALGIILSVLLWNIMADGIPIKSDLLGRFVISAILLRFFVGELSFALNAIRQINSEYVVSKKLLDLFSP